MNYQEIIDSICSAKSMEELIFRVDMWNEAIDSDLCEYTDSEEVSLDKTLRSVVKAVSEGRPATFYLEGMPTYH